MARSDPFALESATVTGGVAAISLHYSKDPQIQRSLRYSVRDAVSFSVMAGGLETYFSAFAIFLKASALQVALVATLPNLLGSLGQLVSAWLGHRINRRKPIIVRGAYAQALVLPFMLALPFLFPDYAIPLVMLALTLYYAAAHIIVPQWTSLMGELVPERRRGRFFAHRTRLATVSSFLALFTGGLLLHGFNLNHRTALGFAVLFAAAFCARLYSAHCLSRMHEPSLHAASLESLLRLGWLRKPEYAAAKRFSLFFILMQSAVGISAPFFSVYMLNVLHFSYLQFMMNTGAAVLVQFLTLKSWGRVSDIMGNRLVLVTTGSLIPFLPALWLFSTDPWYLFGVQIISGFGWGGFSLSATNAVYDLIPREKRSTYQALQSVLLTCGVFIGGMLGAFLIKILPRTVEIGNLSYTLGTTLLWVFLISSLARITVSLIFLPRLAEMRKPRRRLSPYALVYRFTRFNAFMGLMYEVVTRIKKEPAKPKSLAKQEPR
ncbi:MAG TPA: MFS transporter [Gammaproteobacteria bacterium]|nr:MFS transporter [Gammaproteobacteria bacterium]